MSRFIYQPLSLVFVNPTQLTNQTQLLFLITTNQINHSQRKRHDQVLCCYDVCIKCVVIVLEIPNGRGFGFFSSLGLHHGLSDDLLHVLVSVLVQVLHHVHNTYRNMGFMWSEGYSKRCKYKRKEKEMLFKMVWITCCSPPIGSFFAAGSSVFFFLPVRDDHCS